MTSSACPFSADPPGRVPAGAPGPPDQAADAVAAAPEETDDAPPAVPENAETRPAVAVDWTELPDAVRARLADLAAVAVEDLATVDVPAPVRAVARFAPAKRARLGAGPLLTALRTQPGFRAAVVAWAHEHRAAALDTAAADPATAAAAALLLDEPVVRHHLELVSRRAAEAGLRAERDAAVARANRLAAELEQVRAELARTLDPGREVDGRDAELDKLRRRLREQGVRLREARDEAAAARADAEQIRVQTELERKSLLAERDRERERADAERGRAARAVEEARRARQAAREARQADEVRLALLVDTLDGVTAGLRRELDLAGTGPRPADLVGSAGVSRGAAGRVEDPAALDRLLALPMVHLVIDGYNVTKTGYPELTLADQRERLVQQLAALAARTGAEVTVVFDGAQVTAPVMSARGVRVLFSNPGVLADDVIRDLVAGEPEGRPVVVVTSDRAVVDSVRRRGAHPVPSAVLIARLVRV